MTAIRIDTTIDSETLHLPEIKPFIGRKVTIVISDAEPVGTPVTGDWTAAREAAKGLENYDFDLWHKQREWERQQSLNPES